ncbi:MAG: formylglycine-generating enzyme family protein [Deltaproteobacteria bacterium]|nr:formylglycine-generating enzyme family protein [Deltaproteobacteria bacterium]
MGNAARAGSQTSYFFGNDGGRLGDYGWIRSNFARANVQTRPVGLKRPKPWGLHDIYGNAFECVQDYYGEYAASPQAGSGGTFQRRE